MHTRFVHNASQTYLRLNSLTLMAHRHRLQESPGLPIYRERGRADRWTAVHSLDLMHTHYPNFLSLGSYDNAIINLSEVSCRKADDIMRRGRFNVGQQRVLVQGFWLKKVGEERERESRPVEEWRRSCMTKAIDFCIPPLFCPRTFFGADDIVYHYLSSINNSTLVFCSHFALEHP